MKRLVKKNYFILIPIIILMVFSLLNMYNAKYIMSTYSTYFIKQILWFMIGFLIIIACSKYNLENIFSFSYFLYGINVFLLLLVLFLGKEINGTKAWFDLAYFSFQPSELMKLSLLLTLSNLANSLRMRTIRNEWKFIVKVIILTLIPSILTFLEPDTGSVIIYFVIALVVLFACRIRIRWFIFAFLIILFLGFLFFYTYYNFEELFTKILGTSFFYRIDRIISFTNGEGMQIENALIAIGSAGLFGSGINKVSIYFPESPTDFIFASSVSVFGLIGALIILLCYLVLFIILMSLIKNTSKKEIKIFITGINGMFLYQVVQSVLMNIGLMPIIGIPLPFLSYGGSSTLLYFTCIALIINLSGKKEKYPYWIF